MMKDNLEIIRHNAANGRASIKDGPMREGWEAIAEQFEWLIAEVDRLRKIEDELIACEEDNECYPIETAVRVHDVLQANPRPEAE